jgi:hypothetical protein
MTDEFKRGIWNELKSLGWLFTAFGSAVMVVWYASNKVSVIDQGPRDLAALEARLTAQIVKVETLLINLPNDRATAIQVDRRIIENFSKNVDQDTRIQKLEEGQYQLRSDVTGLIKGSNAGPKK